MVRTEKYLELVQSNSHGEVLEELAKDFKLNHYSKIFQLINNIHSSEGHLSWDVLQLRDRFKQEMFTCLERSLPSEDYKKLKEII